MSIIKLSEKQKEVVKAMQLGIRYYENDCTRTLEALMMKGYVKVIFGGEFRLTDLGKQIKL